jgi:hypothetical protein
MARMISGAWTTFRLKSEGWFVARLRQNGKHQLSLVSEPEHHAQ